MAEQLIPFIKGMPYDGTNSAAILADIPAQDVADYGVTIVSEGDGTVVFGWESAGLQTVSVSTGGWLIWQSGGMSSFTDEERNGAYIRRSDLP